MVLQTTWLRYKSSAATQNSPRKPSRSILWLPSSAGDAKMSILVAPRGVCDARQK